MCPDEAAAERAVNEVWESCFNDTRPFDEVSSSEAVAVARTYPPISVDTFSHPDLLAGGKEKHTYDHDLFLIVCQW